MEGCFSAMNAVNTKLCNKMGDQFMSDCLSFLCGEMPIFKQLVMMTCLTFKEDERSTRETLKCE